MGKIIKALILGWIGKKIYDRVSADDEEPEKVVAHQKRAAPKRSSARKPAHRTQRAA